MSRCETLTAGRRLASSARHVSRTSPIHLREPRGILVHSEAQNVPSRARTASRHDAPHRVAEHRALDRTRVDDAVPGHDEARHDRLAHEATEPVLAEAPTDRAGRARTPRPGAHRTARSAPSGPRTAGTPRRRNPIRPVLRAYPPASGSTTLAAQRAASSGRPIASYSLASSAETSCERKCRGPNGSSRAAASSNTISASS